MADGWIVAGLSAMTPRLAMRPSPYVRLPFGISLPEKFSPAIEVDWQKETLAREREEEARLRALGCGPDGCPSPER